MSEQEEVQFFPAWREGLKKFIAAGHQPGDAIPHKWFFEAFGIDMPVAETPLKEAEKAKLAFLGAFETMREHLLTEKQIALASVRGYGYRVVTPQEQTRWAEGEGMDDVKHAVRKMGTRLVNVDLNALDTTHRKENADALARMSMLSGMIRSVQDRKDVAGLTGGE